MKPSLALLSLVTLVGAAGAQPGKPALRPALPLVEIDHDADVRLDSVTLWGDGRWTVEDAQHPERNAKGKLQASVLAQIRTDLARATWKLRPTGTAACHAMTLDRRTILVNGKSVWVQRGCSPQTLDEASARTAQDLFQMLAPAALPAESEAEPVIAIEHREAGRDTITTTLYSDGRWTRMRAEDVGAPMRSEGHLDADVTATIHAALAAAPWTVTELRAHCMAMSAEDTIFTAGKQTFTDVPVCPSKTIDAATLELLRSIRKLLDDQPSKLVCGNTSCADNQICVATTFSGGAQPAHTSTTYACFDQPRPEGGADRCSKPLDRQQTCSVLAP